MYFVIQVTSREEHEMMDRIKRYVDSSYLIDIFIPTRVRQKKVNSKWVDYEDRLFPGYIFVETINPRELARDLRGIDGFAKLVGFGTKNHIDYLPLSEKEEEIIDRLLNRKVDKYNSRLDISHIEIEEGNKIKVIDGPLYGYEGTVVRYNLHKRIATIDMNFGGNIIKTNVGIDVIEKI